MNELLSIGWVLVSTLVALYAGRYLGRKFVRGRLSGEWVLVLSSAIGLISAWVFIFVLHLPVEYVFWVAALIGSVAYGAT